jgi:2-polyprenyl-6-methoxyphenol hydroxylase-like FAD-dependent oxidoreductase
MKVAIVGGGPSGLYLALLLKRSEPEWTVEIIEQNAADATFGFGVVMADTGLQQLREADASSYDALSEATRQHQHQIIVQDETAIHFRLPVKGGAIPRLTLLQILERHAEKAGVVIHYRERIENTADLARFGLQDADVVVGADGINSVIRRAPRRTSWAIILPGMARRKSSTPQHWSFASTRAGISSPTITPTAMT